MSRAPRCCPPPWRSTTSWTCATSPEREGSPRDGFTEYLGYPDGTSPRWGDYSWAIYLPGGSNRLYFVTNYIQFPNCTGSAFTLTIGPAAEPGTTSPTRGTSVNYVVP